MITATSLKHPVMQDKILSALIQSNEHAVHALDRHGLTFIQNSKGHNVMRLNVYRTEGAYPETSVVVTGPEGVDVTDMVETALGQKFCDLL